MAYRVELAKSAEAQLEAWFKGLERAILSLERHAERCPLAPESFDPDRPVRVLHYGRRPHVYRVCFSVDDHAKLVRVLHVRRGARRPVAPDDITGN